MQRLEPLGNYQPVYQAFLRSLALRAGDQRPHNWYFLAWVAKGKPHNDLFGPSDLETRRNAEQYKRKFCG